MEIYIIIKQPWEICVPLINYNAKYVQSQNKVRDQFSFVMFHNTPRTCQEYIREGLQVGYKQQKEYDNKIHFASQFGRHEWHIRLA